MTAKDHDKVKVIVEETVQRVFLLDPDAAQTREFVEALQHLVTGGIVENIPMFGENKPPAVLGHRAKKGPPVPILLRMMPQEAEWRRFSGMTLVIPDENGAPSEERKFTNTTVTRRPVKK
jgi:hypothetical protein